MSPRKTKLVTLGITVLVILTLLLMAKVFWPVQVHDREEEPLSEEIESHTPKELPDFKTLSIDTETERYEVNVSYPQFITEESAWNLTKINEEIQQDVESQVGNFSRVAEDFDNSILDSRAKSSFIVSFSILGNPARSLLSVVFTISDYSVGAAHPNTNVHTRTFDLNTGEDISITEFVEGTSPYDVLASEAQAQLREHATIQEFNLEEDQWLIDGSSAQPENYEAFAIKGNELVIYFNPYQVAPYAAGIIEISILLPE